MKTSHITLVAGILIAGIGLVWVFHDLSFSDFADQFKRTHIGLILLGVAIDIMAYCWQALRWNLLLNSLSPISYKQTLQALYTGIFLNIFMPLRFGELARAFGVARMMRIPIAKTLATIGAEYTMDGFWLALALIATLSILPLPSPLSSGGMAIGIGLLIMSALLVLLIRKKHASFSEPIHQSRFSIFNRITYEYFKAMATLRTISTSPRLFSALGVSALVLIFRMAAFFIIMRGCNISIGFPAAAAVLLIKYVGLIIPNAPSNVGGYQFFIVYGLLLFGIEKTAAAGFAVVIFTVLLIAQAVAGSIAFVTSGMTITQIKQEIQSS